jgi:uncharacterized protein YndB with AHSA1/START domain
MPGKSPDTVYVTYIATTPERVWQALTSPEFTRQYFFGREVESDWKEGSQWRLLMEDGTVDVQGTVQISDPPRLLEVSWHVEWNEEARKLPYCRVRYEIEPMGSAVRLTMTEIHDEPIEEKYLEGGRQGWPMILSGLKTLLETGRPLAVEVPARPS